MSILGKTFQLETVIYTQSFPVERLWGLGVGQQQAAAQDKLYQ
jgi:hypothetical protein